MTVTTGAGTVEKVVSLQFTITINNGILIIQHTSDHCTSTNIRPCPKY